MNIEQDIKGPDVKFAPPMVFILMMLLAYGLSLFFPISISSSYSIENLGLAVAGLGFAVIFGAIYSFKRARTALSPWNPATTIVQSGVFAYSRNPIYLAFCFITLGTGLFFNSLWLAISLIPSIIILFFIAVKKEEIYLENKFGQEYLAYKANVRRWL